MLISFELAGQDEIHFKVFADSYVKKLQGSLGVPITYRAIAKAMMLRGLELASGEQDKPKGTR